MPDALTEQFDVLPVIHGERCVRVSNVVQPDASCSRAIHQAVEPRCEGVRVQGSALWTNHDVGVIGVVALEHPYVMVEAFEGVRMLGSVTTDLTWVAGGYSIRSCSTHIGHGTSRQAWSSRARPARWSPT